MPTMTEHRAAASAIVGEMDLPVLPFFLWGRQQILKMRIPDVHKRHTGRVAR